MTASSKKVVKFKIEYRANKKEDIVGLNEYKNLHWRKLRPLYDKIKTIMTWLIIQQQPPSLKWFEIRVYQHTNYDMDNLVGMVKPFVDALRSKKIVPEDDRKFWDYLSVQYAPKLEKGTIIFEVTGEMKTINK